MYWIVGGLLLLFSIIEIRNKHIDSILFNFSYLILLLMVVLRQGQGTDYYNYMEIYKEVQYYSSESWLLLLYRNDPGFAILNYLAQIVGISYKIFSAIFSLFIMILAYPFFYKHCSKSIIPLFFFYTTFYLIYPFSAIRQGFGIAVLLGVLYSYLKEKRYFLYYLISVLVSSVHLSFIVTFILPLIYHKSISRKYLSIICLFAIIILIVYNPFEKIAVVLAHGRLDSYIDGSSSTKYLAMVVRLLILIPLFLIPESTYRKNVELNNLRKILLCGFCIYSIFSFSDITASRIETYFRVFEGIFYAKLIHETKLKKISVQICFCYMLLLCVLFTKNINALIDQGNYKNCNIFTYPYLSLFDDEETIYYYRKSLGFADRME